MSSACMKKEKRPTGRWRSSAIPRYPHCACFSCFTFNLAHGLCALSLLIVLLVDDIQRATLHTKSIRIAYPQRKKKTRLAKKSLHLRPFAMGVQICTIDVFCGAKMIGKK
jgi:hypothetical protein